jgi:acyl-coenzyme A thioesterase PaaI-like protein
MTAGTPDVELLRFSEVSAVSAGESGRFRATVSPEWTIGGKANGGYLLAMLGRAAASLTTQGQVMAASAHYLRAPEPGPAAIEGELLRGGRSTSQVRARLSQGDRALVEALVTLSEFDRSAVPFWDRGVPVVDEVSFAECVRLPPRTPDGGRVAMLEQIDLRLDPASSGITSGRPSGRGELSGWLALPGEEDFDPISLLFAVDAFPPATFDIAFSGWQPTLELTVYVRAIPARGPVRVLKRVQLIDARRVDEQCYVWDRTGRLVAQATQLAGVLLG